MPGKLLFALAVSLLLPATLPAQRHHGGGFHGSASPGVQLHAAAPAFQFQSFPVQPLYYDQLYYGSPYYGGYGGFSYSLPYGSYGYAPADYGSDSRAPVVMINERAPGGSLEQQIVYVPSYLRPDSGPSLGEIARALRAARTRKN